MKKVLILAYDFPPNNSVGSLRPHSWFKYLKEFGFYPVVVTRYWEANIRRPVDTIRASSKKIVEIEEQEQGTIIRVPYNPNLSNKILIKFSERRLILIRKLVSFLFSILKYSFPTFDSTKNIYQEAEKYLRKSSCDVIIATGEPFILFKYASKLSKQYGIPWIADYRDEWSTNCITNNFYFLVRLSRLMLAYYFKELEKTYVSSALLITTVSSQLQKRLKRFHKDKPTFVIYNGYDFEIKEKIEQSKSCFQIAYSGTVYSYFPVELFLDGYRSFIKKSGCEKTRVIFYGVDFYSAQKKYVYSFDQSLRNNIFTTERLPFEQLLSELQKSNVLLLFSEGETGAIPVKLFEYLAIDRMILMVKNDFGPMEKIMKDCNGGIICSTVDEVEVALSKLYGEYLNNGSVEHKSINYEVYSRRNQVKILGELLLKVVDNFDKKRLN